MAKPNVTWTQFAVCNDNQTKAFETMCRRLFRAEFLKGKRLSHTDHNTPGVEVLPILEPERDDGLPQKRISFQAKYVQQPSYAYSEFKKSAQQAARYYKDSLDLVTIIDVSVHMRCSTLFSDRISLFGNKAYGFEQFQILCPCVMKLPLVFTHNHPHVTSFDKDIKG